MSIALIAKNELVHNFDGTSGYRVAEIFEIQPWEPAPENEFIQCDASVIADEYYFDTASNTIKVKPIPPVTVQNHAATTSQPTTNGLASV